MTQRAILIVKYIDDSVRTILHETKTAGIDDARRIFNYTPDCVQVTLYEVALEDHVVNWPGCAIPLT